MSVITIKPSPLSSKFIKKISGSLDIYSETDNGDKFEGSYKGLKLPNSKQIEKPIVYSQTQRMWKLSGFKENTEELQELAKACRLTNDLPKHENYGRLITTCDINDVNDPFFKHNSLKIRLEEGFGLLDTSKPLDKILYEGALANKRFQIGGDKHNVAISMSAKYILVNSEVDMTYKKAARDLKKQAAALHESLSNDKKMQIAYILGLTTSEVAPLDLVDDLLWDYLEDTKSRVLGDLTKQQYFIKIASADTDTISSRLIIEKSIKLGIIKRYPDRYECFGTVIGKDLEASINYLLSPLNSELYFKLKSAVEAS